MVPAPPPILRGHLKISGLKFWGSPEIFSKFRGDLKLRGDLKFKGGGLAYFHDKYIFMFVGQLSKLLICNFHFTCPYLQNLQLSSHCNVGPPPLVTFICFVLFICFVFLIKQPFEKKGR